MILISILAVILWNFNDNFLSIYLAKISEPLHFFCLSKSPASSYKEFYSAIVCGSNLKDSFFKENLKNSGLLHLIVVSGSHLVFLGILFDMFLGKTNFKKIKLTIIFFYSLVSLAQPPVIRAFIHLCLINLNQDFFLNWSKYQKVWLTLAITLSLFPNWASSYSFLMSLCAGLALCISSHLSGVTKHFVIYLILFPILLPLTPPHPLSILFNLIIAPLLGLVLFPLSFLSFIFPISKITDFLWYLTDKVLGLAPLSHNIEPLHVPKTALWVYVIGLNLFFIFFYTKNQRSRAFND